MDWKKEEMLTDGAGRLEKKEVPKGGGRRKRAVRHSCRRGEGEEKGAVRHSGLKSRGGWWSCALCPNMFPEP
jgi:hypothetical protein